jgi:hypothetical protein
MHRPCFLLHPVSIEFAGNKGQKERINSADQIITIGRLGIAQLVLSLAKGSALSTETRDCPFLLLVDGVTSVVFANSYGAGS